MKSYSAVFSLYEDKPGLINCRTTFVEFGDPTGYKWAMTYLKDYAHWEWLMKSTWFREAYDVWMHELKQRVRSEALGVLREVALTAPPAQATPAAKYLASFEWEKSEARGRPSKAEVTGRAKEAAKALEDTQDDMERIGLRLVKN